MAWYKQEPQAALKLLTGMMQQYIEYDVQKFRKKHGSGLPNATSQPKPEETSTSGNKTATQKKHVSIAEQKRQFRQYLQKKPGFKDFHPYLWDDLKDIGMQLLKDSTDIEKSVALIQEIKDLEPQIGALKRKYGLKTQDNDVLKDIEKPELYEQPKPTKLMSEQQHLKTSDWIKQIDIDCFLLDDRIKQCSQIHSDVQELLNEALIKSNLVEEEDFMFAGVKAFERSSHKLLEYIDEKRNNLLQEGMNAAESSVYDLKDLLRGSIISDSAAQTKQIVEKIFGLKYAKVVNMKNGFKTKGNKPFDPSKQADIKLILLVGSGDDYDFEELVEIQIIQRINLELKKIEHKLQDFTREWESFVLRADENRKLFESFKKAILDNDLKAADHLSSSRVSKLQSVVNILVPYQPNLQLDQMTSTQLLNARFAFRDGPQRAIYETLQGLNDSRKSIQELKLDLNKDAVELSILKINKEIYYLNVNSSISCIVNSNDDDIKQVGTHDGKIYEQNRKTNLYKMKFDGHSSDILAVVQCPTTNRLWSGSSDKSIKEWQVGPEDGACARTLEGHSREVTALAQCPTTKRLQSGSWDKTIKEWRIGPEDDGACSRTLEGHTKEVTTLAQCPTTKRLWSGSRDATIKEWRVGLEDDGACARTLEGHSQNITALAQCPKTNRLWSGSWDKTIKEWRIGPEDDGACVRTLKDPREVTALAQCPKTNRLWSGSWDFTVKEWRIGPEEDGACANTLKGHFDWINALTQCPTTKRLQSGSSDKTIKEWCVGAEDDGARTLEGNYDEVLALAQCPTTKRLWSGSRDATIKEWRVGPEDDGACVRTLEGHSDYIEALAQCPTAKRLWSGSWDKTIKEWRIGPEDDGACVRTLEGHSDMICALAQCPTTKRLWSGSSDKTIKEWCVGAEDDGACVRTLEGHSMIITTLAQCPKTKRLWSGSQQKIKEWRVGLEDDGACTRTLKGHFDWINSLAQCPTTNRLQSGSDDKTIRMWCSQSGYLLKCYSCQFKVRSLQVSPDSEYLVANFKGSSQIIVLYTESGQIAQEIKNENALESDSNIVCDFQSLKINQVSKNNKFQTQPLTVQDKLYSNQNIIKSDKRGTHCHEYQYLNFNIIKSELTQSKASAIEKGINCELQNYEDLIDKLNNAIKEVQIIKIPQNN